jgi:2-(1,2-epoxy-1,2-dihydrophenyl)acetyl-CoA isomerase
METILIERDGGVVTVTMNRPERKNAVNQTMLAELLAAFREVAERRDDRVLVLTGAGDAFCSGADLTNPADITTDGLGYMRRVGELVLALHNLAKPTIAKVGGVAAGLGCNLALGCDLIVAADTARFSEIFARRGLSIDGGGSWLLPRLVGLHRAKELAFFADILSAAEAAAMGLVNRVVPAAELDGFVAGWATRLAAGPPIALSMTKTMLNNAFAVSMAQAVEDEARCQNVNFRTADMAEAMRAFAEKRDPEFRGA